MNLAKITVIRNFLLFAVGLALTPASQADVVLYGITGDGAGISETLYTLNTADASATFFMTLGNGDDGETIGFNPDDGFMYHASGISDGDRFWEAINLETKTIVISTQFVGPNVDEEQLAITYDPTTDRFLVTDRDFELFSTTLGGVATDIGDVENHMKGLAFVGSDLYGAEVSSDELHALNPLTGATLTTVNVTVGGNPVDGCNGLATHPVTGELWAIVKVGSDRMLATINTATGVATVVGPLSDKFAGIAFSGAPPEMVPTLAQWGIITLILALASAAFVRIRRLSLA